MHISPKANNMILALLKTLHERIIMPSTCLQHSIVQVIKKRNGWILRARKGNGLRWIPSKCFFHNSFHLVIFCISCYSYLYQSGVDTNERRRLREHYLATPISQIAAIRPLSHDLSFQQPQWGRTHPLILVWVYHSLSLRRKILLVGWNT